MCNYFYLRVVHNYFIYVVHNYCCIYLDLLFEVMQLYQLIKHKIN